MPDDINARMDAFQVKCEDAADALGEVLLDSQLTGYQPHRDVLLHALSVLETESTCGDCVEGRCHWGGKRSRESIAAAKQGRDVGGCGCARHEASVEARDRTRRLRAAGVNPAEGGV